MAATHRRGPSTKVKIPSDVERSSRGSPVDRKSPRGQRTHFWLDLGDYMLGPSPNSRMSRLVFRSRHNIHAELKRQLKYNRFIIHPFSRFRMLWNILMISLILITLVFVPYIAAYATNPDIVTEVSVEGDYVLSPPKSIKSASITVPTTTTTTAMMTTAQLSYSVTSTGTTAVSTEVYENATTRDETETVLSSNESASTHDGTWTTTPWNDSIITLNGTETAFWSNESASTHDGTWTTTPWNDSIITLNGTETAFTSNESASTHDGTWTTTPWNDSIITLNGTETAFTSNESASTHDGTTTPWNDSIITLNRTQETLVSDEKSTTTHDGTWTTTPWHDSITTHTDAKWTSGVDTALPLIYVTDFTTKQPYSITETTSHTENTTEVKSTVKHDDDIAPPRIRRQADGDGALENDQNNELTNNGDSSEEKDVSLYVSVENTAATTHSDKETTVESTPSTVVVENTTATTHSDKGTADQNVTLSSPVENTEVTTHSDNITDGNVTFVSSLENTTATTHSDKETTDQNVTSSNSVENSEITTHGDNITDRNVTFVSSLENTTATTHSDKETTDQNVTFVSSLENTTATIHSEKTTTNQSDVTQPSFFDSTDTTAFSSNQTDIEASKTAGTIVTTSQTTTYLTTTELLRPSTPSLELPTQDTHEVISGMTTSAGSSTTTLDEKYFYTMHVAAEAQIFSRSFFWFWFNIILDVLLILDIVVIFRTGYLMEDEVIVIDNRAIARRYMNTWFFVDLLSVLPVNEIYTIATMKQINRDWFLVFLFSYVNSLVERSNRALKPSKLSVILCTVICTCSYMNLIKGLKVSRLFSYLQSVYQYFFEESMVLLVISRFLVMFLYIHWSACLQYIICFVSHYPDLSNVWIGKNKIDKPETTMFEKYTRSMLRAVSHVYAVDVGVYTPWTYDELLVVIISLVLSVTFIALLLTALFGMMNSFDAAADKYTYLKNQLQEFLRFYHVPVSLQNRVLSIFAQKYRQKYFHNEKFLQSSLLTPPCREDINIHMCRLVLQKIAIFASAPREFLLDLVTRLEFQVFLKDDIIIEAGERNSSIHFIDSGKVITVDPMNNRVVDKLNEGDYFGVMPVILNEPHELDVAAVDQCDVFLLSRQSFNQIVVKFPQFQQMLVKTTTERRDSGIYD